MSPLSPGVLAPFKLGVGPARPCALANRQGVSSIAEVVCRGETARRMPKRTGEDVNEICQETSLGGLVGNVVEC